MPNRLAKRLAAITMPSPLRPPPTHTGRPESDASIAISQLAKNVSPSTCRIRSCGVSGTVVASVSTQPSSVNPPAQSGTNWHKTGLLFGEYWGGVGRYFFRLCF